MRYVTLFALFGLLASCGDRDQLKEGHARHTAEALIAAEAPRLRDFHHMEWRKLERVSPTEAHGTASLVYRFQTPGGGAGEEEIQGKFVYRKDPQRGWVLVGIDFPNPNNLFHSLDEEVLVQVTSARVEIGDSLGRSRSTAARVGGDRGEVENPDAAADSLDEIDAPAISLLLARRAADRGLESISNDGERWTATEFGRVAAVDESTAELAAVVVPEGQPSPEYRGTFHYRYDPSAGQWWLTAMSFRAEGVEPLTRTFQPALPVR